MTGIPAASLPTRLSFVTFRDAVHRLLDQAGAMENDGTVSARTLRIAQRSVRYANDNLASYSDTWKLYRGKTQVTLPGSYTTGTVVVNSATQKATLTGGTWPAWAWYGELHFGTQRTLVSSRDSDTVLSLMSPVDDYASGAYSLVCSTVPISPLIRKLDAVYDAVSGLPLGDVSFDNSSHYASSKPGAAAYPSLVSIAGDVRFMGGVALHIQPPASSQRTLEFAYHRRPRPLRTYEIAGTVTIAGTTATVDAAVLKSLHVGSIMRIDDEDRVVVAVTSTTTCTLDSAWVVDANSDYLLSDPLDALPGSMSEAMIRLAEKELSRSVVQDKANYRSSGFDQALKLAMTEDSMMTTPASAVPWFHPGGMSLGEVEVV